MSSAKNIYYYYVVIWVDRMFCMEKWLAPGPLETNYGISLLYVID